MVGSAVSNASKVISFIKNPASLLDLPFIKDSRLFQLANYLYQKGKGYVDKIKGSIINPASNFINDKYVQALNKVKETNA